MRNPYFLIFSLILTGYGNGLAQPMGDDAALPAPVLVEEKTLITPVLPAPILIEEKNPTAQVLPPPIPIEEKSSDDTAATVPPPITDPLPSVAGHDSLEFLDVPQETEDLPAPVLIPQPLVLDEPVQADPVILQDLPPQTTDKEGRAIVSGDEKAVPEEIGSEPAAIQQLIGWLLKKAAAAMQAKKLTTPKDESAAEYYNQVLRLDPKNEDAAAGKKEITDTYVRWGHAAVRRGQLRRARTFGERAESVIPGSAFDLNNAIHRAEKQPATANRSGTDVSQRPARTRDPTLKEAWGDMIDLRQPTRSWGAEDILDQ